MSWTPSGNDLAGNESSRGFELAIEVVDMEVPEGGGRREGVMKQDGPLPSSQAESSQPSADAVPQVSNQKLSPGWELFGILMVCAVAGVAGTHIRIQLEEAFNTAGLKVMEGWTSLFQDMPANMVGCFFMGIVGVVCKPYIARYSELIALGLATGLMGSITTYSSWNQDMAELFVAGLWARALFGLLLGLELPFVSLLVGIHFGKAIVWACKQVQKRTPEGAKPAPYITPDNSTREKAVALVAGALWLGLLLPGDILLAAFQVGDTVIRTENIGACIAPLGVWLRWYLSRFNGTLLKGSPFEWIPLGTFMTNMLASVAVTVLRVANVQIEDHTTSVWLEAISKGVMGCMSTVSTFMVEILKLGDGRAPWKAYAYIALSVVCSQVLALVVYGIPVWVEHYPGAMPDPEAYEAN